MSYARIYPESPIWELVYLPDAHYTYEANAALQAKMQTQMDWVLATRAASNIRLVAHSGDMTNSYGTAEFGRAQAIFNTLRNVGGVGVPFVMCPGNHDAPAYHDYQRYKTYFPESWFTGYTWPSSASWGGSCPTSGTDDSVTDENSCQCALVSGGGIGYVVVTMHHAGNASDAPRQAELDWVKSRFDAYPTRKGILITHQLLQATGSKNDRAPAELWTDVVVPCANVFLVLSGHVYVEGAVLAKRRTDTHDTDSTLPAGRTVHQVLFNPQGSNDGDGWLRRLRFDVATGTISVSTYSPYLSASLADADNQFALDLI